MQTPPHDISAEKAVIGGILVFPDAFETASEQLTATDFHTESHRKIFAAVHELVKKGSPVDLVSLGITLKNSGDLERSGGHAYLTELIDFTPISVNIAYYAGIVKRKAIARRTIDAARRIAQAAQASDDIDTLLATAFGHLQDISKDAVQDNPFKTLDQLADAYQEHVRTIGTTRFITGFPEIDAVIRGVGPKEVCYILGGPGLFKSALLHNIFIGACERTGKYHPYFSLEMSDIRMFERTVQIGCQHYTHNIESGFHHHTGYREKVLTELKQKSIDKLLICDHGGLTIDQIEHYTRAARNRFGEIGAIGIDLLGLTTAPGTTGLFELIEANAPAIMNMAKRLNIPVIVLAHIKRLAPGEEITMESGKGSGAIEQYARFMLGLWRNKDKDIICSVLKNTNGEADVKFKVDIKREFLKFNSFAPHNEFAAKNVEQRKSRIRRDYVRDPIESDPY
ncbi:MAG: replicative DNA helicase [Geobacteraceae bacterium]